MNGLNRFEVSQFSEHVKRPYGKNSDVIYANSQVFVDLFHRNSLIGISYRAFLSSRKSVCNKLLFDAMTSTTFKLPSDINSQKYFIFGHAS